MRTPFQNKQTGTSMIELMIASALLAIVGLGATAFFKRVAASDYEARARTTTIAEIQGFLSAIERDFKLRDMTTPPDKICGGTSCSDFTVNRMVRYTSGPDINRDVPMEIRYQTKCDNSGGTAIREKLKGDLNFSNIYSSAVTGAMNGKCLKTAGCGDGRYPQIVITPKNVANANPPSYPRWKNNSAKFPDLTDKTSLASGVIGAAICAEGAGNNSDRIIIEAVFMNSEGKLRVEKKELSMPRANVANIQMLPNNPFATP
jgi:Tfp pilus assembly protein PilV